MKPVKRKRTVHIKEGDPINFNKGFKQPSIYKSYMVYNYLFYFYFFTVSITRVMSVLFQVKIALMYMDQTTTSILSYY